MANPPSAAAPMIPGSTPSGAAPAAPGDDDSQEGQTTITITCVGDGTYTITQDDGDDDSQGQEPAGDDDSASEQPVTVQSAADVLHVVKQMLAQAGSAGGAQAAWQAEASKRDATGMPAPAGPAMSM